MYLAIDPGVTTGYASFDEKGNFVIGGQIVDFLIFGDLLERFLEEKEVVRVLYETYKIFPHVAQGGSEVEAAQCIGVIKWICRKHSVPISGVEPRHRRIGYRWANLREPSNHSKSHGIAARGIGEFWLRHNGVKPNDKA